MFDYMSEGFEKKKKTITAFISFVRGLVNAPQVF